MDAEKGCVVGGEASGEKKSYAQVVSEEASGNAELLSNPGSKYMCADCVVPRPMNVIHYNCFNQRHRVMLMADWDEMLYQKQSGKRIFIERFPNSHSAGTLVISTDAFYGSRGDVCMGAVFRDSNLNFVYNAAKYEARADRITGDTAANAELDAALFALNIAFEVITPKPMSIALYTDCMLVVYSYISGATSHRIYQGKVQLKQVNKLRSIAGEHLWQEEGKLIPNSKKPPMCQLTVNHIHRVSNEAAHLVAQTRSTRRGTRFFTPALPKVLHKDLHFARWFEPTSDKTGHSGSSQTK